MLLDTKMTLIDNGKAIRTVNNYTDRIEEKEESLPLFLQPISMLLYYLQNGLSKRR